jgi:nucleotide-binding universal stress UspA family protein
LITMKELHTIVVATDFSDGSIAALEQGVRVGAWHRAQVRAVHVIDIIVGLEPEPQLAAMHLAMQDGMLEETRKDWAKLAARIKGAENVVCEIVLDSRVRGILGEATARKADLLVMGATPSGEGDTGYGATTASCVRHAPCSVLIVRQKHAGPFKRVLACVDFSAGSLGALEEAVRIATQDSAQMRLVHAYRAPWQERRLRGLPLVQDTMFQENYVKTLEGRLAEFVKPLEHELGHLKAERVVVAADTHRAGIVRAAREYGADLVVLGTRGKTNLRDVLLGSTAERVLGEAPCSVLAVRTGA